DGRGDVLLPDRLQRGLEVGRQRQLQEGGAAQGGVGPPLGGGAAGGRLVLGPADVELAVGGRRLPRGVAEAAHRVGDRGGADDPVGAAAGQLDRARARDRDQQRRRLRRQRVEAGAVDAEVAA